MKTLEKIAFALIALVLIVTMIIVVVPKKKTETYPQTMVVVKVNNDVVTLADFNGFTYEFKGAEDWMVGDICSCIMDDNGTEKVLDDKIIDTKYSGYFEEWK